MRGEKEISMRKHVKGNVSWVGYLDWEMEKFHGDDYSIYNGSSQNAYLIEEEKTVLIDTVWTPHRFDFVENLKREIDLNKIDCIIMNHAECDHSGALTTLLEEIPGTPIYCTALAQKSIEGQFGKRGWNFRNVKTGDSIDIGNGKKLIFVEMRMIHWPDSMATYMTGDNILFANDAFGQHFACGELFNDLADQDLLYKEALKYYVNIVNPYSPMVAKKLKELDAMNLTVDIIAPSHGVIWRDNPMQIVDKYREWSEGKGENRITIAYDSMWEGTMKIAHAIADEINKQSPETTVKLFSIAKADKDEIMTEVFRSKAIAVGSPTINNGIMSSVAGWLEYLQELKFKGKRAAAFGCYGWSGESVKKLQERLADAGFEVVEENVRANWRPWEEDFAKIPALVKALLGEEQEEKKAPEASGVKYRCGACGYIYDPALGDPGSDIPAGTSFEDLPETWKCPICMMSKAVFKKVE